MPNRPIAPGGSLHALLSMGRWVLPAVMASLVTAVPAAAQQAETVRAPFTIWLSGILFPVIGDGVVMAVSAQTKWLVISSRLAATGGDDPCMSSDCGPDSGDLSLLVGVGSRPGRRWHVSGGAGIGMGFEVPWTIPLQAEVAWRPLSFLGVALMGYASFGFGDAGGGGGSPSFGGLSLGLQLGKLR